MRRLFYVLALLPFLVSGAYADFTGSGPGFTIPDDDAAGASSVISVAQSPDEVISNVSVTLIGLNHTWVGDLIVTLSGPGGTIDLMSRTGQVGGVGAGDSTDLGGDYTFADGGADWWGTAGGLGGTDVMPPGTYAPTTVDGAPTSFMSTFAGTFTNGDWTLTISDNAGLDTGDLGGWRLDITSSAVIPEPGSIALLGIAGLGIAMIRRRQ